MVGARRAAQLGPLGEVVPGDVRGVADARHLSVRPDGAHDEVRVDADPLDHQIDAEERLTHGDAAAARHEVRGGQRLAGAEGDAAAGRRHRGGRLDVRRGAVSGVLVDSNVAEGSISTVGVEYAGTSATVLSGAGRDGFGSERRGLGGTFGHHVLREGARLLRRAAAGGGCCREGGAAEECE